MKYDPNSFYPTSVSKVLGFFSDLGSTTGQKVKTYDEALKHKSSFSKEVWQDFEHYLEKNMVEKINDERFKKLNDILNEEI